MPATASPRVAAAVEAAGAGRCGRLAAVAWQVAVVTVWTAVYFATSAWSGIWNKELVDRGGVSPVTLTLLHLLVSLASDYALMHNSAEGAPRFPPRHGRHTAWDVVRDFTPISVFVILSKLTTYLSYQSVSIALSHTAKASEPLFNAAIAAALFHERYSSAVYASLLPIAVGVTLASTTDYSYNHAGFGWAVMSAATKVLQNIYHKRLMQTGRFSFQELHMYCGGASLVILTPVLLVQALTGTSHPFAAFPIVSLAACSVLQYLSSISSYMVLHLVAHLTFTVINVLKRLVIIVAGMVFYHQAMRPINLVGVILALTGIFAYNIVKDLGPLAGPANPWSAASWLAWLQTVSWKYNHLDDASTGSKGNGGSGSGSSSNGSSSNGSSAAATAAASHEGGASALRVYAGGGSSSSSSSAAPNGAVPVAGDAEAGGSAVVVAGKVGVGRPPHHRAHNGGHGRAGMPYSWLFSPERESFGSRATLLTAAATRITSDGSASSGGSGGGSEGGLGLVLTPGGGGGGGGDLPVPATTALPRSTSPRVRLQFGGGGASVATGMGPEAGAPAVSTATAAAATTDDGSSSGSGGSGGSGGTGGLRARLRSHGHPPSPSHHAALSPPSSSCTSGGGLAGGSLAGGPVGGGGGGGFGSRTSHSHCGSARGGGDGSSSNSGDWRDACAAPNIVASGSGAWEEVSGRSRSSRSGSSRHQRLTPPLPPPPTSAL